MKYFVVSKLNLYNLIQAAYDRANADAFEAGEIHIERTISEVNKYYGECITREVPEWATHYALYEETNTRSKATARIVR